MDQIVLNIKWDNTWNIRGNGMLQNAKQGEIPTLVCILDPQPNVDIIICDTELKVDSYPLG